MNGILVVVLVFFALAAALGAVAYFTYQKKLRRAKAIERGLKMVPILIHLPPPSSDTESGSRDLREVMREKTSQAEVLYNLIAGTATDGFKSNFYGQRHIALELIVVDGLVHFYAAVPVALVSVVKKAVQTAYPGARLEEVEDHNIFNQEGRLAATLGGEMVLRTESAYPIATYEELERDPMEALLTTVSALDKQDGVAIQIMLRPAGDAWIKKAVALADRMRKGKHEHSDFTAMNLAKAALKAPSERLGDEKAHNGGSADVSQLQLSQVERIEEKTKHPGFQVLIRVIVSTGSTVRSQQLLRDISTSFSLYENPGLNGFKFLPALDVQGLVTAFIFRFFPNEITSNILNSAELATLFHLPDSMFTPSTSVERQQSKQVDGPTQLSPTGLLFGFNEFRGVKKEIRLSAEDRRRHTYILGQTGTGKSTMLENLAVQDMLAGNGFAFIDPHGDSAEKLLALVPKDRAEDVIYFNPADTQYPLGLNLFEFTDPAQKDFLVQETINMLYKLYDPGHTGIIGPRYEHWYRNAALTLMADPNGSTFIEIPKVFTDTDYLKNKFKYLKDPTVIDFWTKEMGQTSDFHKSEMLGWFVSKFGAFQNNEVMRNIIGQTKSSFNLRDVMDKKKILIVNLSKGRIGELNSQLLGMIFVIKFQAAAMSRADVPESERPDFALYVDEFQNFSTDSFASILSEARKYRLNLIVANQFIGQLSNEIRDAVFGNIGTIVAHRMGPEDAEFMVKQFAPVFDASDLVNIPNFNAAMRLMIGGLPSQPFSIADSPQLGAPNPELGMAVKQLSAAKYGHDKAMVEADLIARMSGHSIPAPTPPTAAPPTIAEVTPVPAPTPAPTVPASTQPVTNVPAPVQTSPPATPPNVPETVSEVATATAPMVAPNVIPELVKQAVVSDPVATGVPNAAAFAIPEASPAALVTAETIDSGTAVLAATPPPIGAPPIGASPSLDEPSQPLPSQAPGALLQTAVPQSSPPPIGAPPIQIPPIGAPPVDLGNSVGVSADPQVAIDSVDNLPQEIVPPQNYQPQAAVVHQTVPVADLAAPPIGAPPIDIPKVATVPGSPSQDASTLSFNDITGGKPQGNTEPTSLDDIPLLAEPFNTPGSDGLPLVDDPYGSIDVLGEPAPAGQEPPAVGAPAVTPQPVLGPQIGEGRPLADDPYAEVDILGGGAATTTLPAAPAPAIVEVAYAPEPKPVPVAMSQLEPPQVQAQVTPIYDEPAATSGPIITDEPKVISPPEPVLGTVTETAKSNLVPAPILTPDWSAAPEPLEAAIYSEPTEPASREQDLDYKAHVAEQASLPVAPSLLPQTQASIPPEDSLQVEPIVEIPQAAPEPLIKFVDPAAEKILNSPYEPEVKAENVIGNDGKPSLSGLPEGIQLVDLSKKTEPTQATPAPTPPGVVITPPAQVTTPAPLTDPAADSLAPALEPAPTPSIQLPPSAGPINNIQAPTGVAAPQPVPTPVPDANLDFLVSVAETLPESMVKAAGVVPETLGSNDSAIKAVTEEIKPAAGQNTVATASATKEPLNLVVPDAADLAPTVKKEEGQSVLQGAIVNQAPTAEPELAAVVQPRSGETQADDVNSPNAAAAESGAKTLTAAESIERAEHKIDDLLSVSLIRPDSSPGHHRLPDPSEKILSAEDDPESVGPSRAPSVTGKDERFGGYPAGHHGLKVIQPLEPIIPAKERFAAELASLSSRPEAATEKSSHAPAGIIAAPAGAPASEPLQSGTSTNSEKTSTQPPVEDDHTKRTHEEVGAPKVVEAKAEAETVATLPKVEQVEVPAPVTDRPNGPTSSDTVIEEAKDFQVPVAQTLLPSDGKIKQDIITPEAPATPKAEAVSDKTEYKSEETFPKAHEAEVIEPTDDANKVQKEEAIKHHHTRGRKSHDNPVEIVASEAEAEHNRPTEAAVAAAPLTGKLILPTRNKPELIPEPASTEKPKKLAPGEVFVDATGNVMIGE